MSTCVLRHTNTRIAYPLRKDLIVVNFDVQFSDPTDAHSRTLAEINTLYIRSQVPQLEGLLSLSRTQCWPNKRNLAFGHLSQISLVFVLLQVDFEEGRTVIDTMLLKAPQNNEGELGGQVLILPVIL